MSALAVEVMGRGPPLVLLHGWALNSAVFLHVTGALAARHTLHLVDLPGHGVNGAVMPGDSLAAWADAVRAVVPVNAAWLGWSLGGLVALRAALDAPEDITALTLVASTPRFLTAPDWPAAQTAQAVARVAQGLHTDYRRTVRDFLALQVLGDEHAHTSLRELNAALATRPAPAESALVTGLGLLQASDLRAEVPTLRVPLLTVMGRMDRLTPPAAGEWLATHAPRGRCVVLPKVAHAPFISHPEAFLATLTPFLAEAA